MTPPTIPNLWDYIERALAIDARKLHFSANRPVLARIREGELTPLEDDAPPLERRQVLGMLARVVDPERWEQFERTGEGEVTLAREGGRRVRIVLFRGQGEWNAVVHL